MASTFELLTGPVEIGRMVAIPAERCIIASIERQGVDAGRGRWFNVTPNRSTIQNPLPKPRTPVQSIP